MQLLSRWKNIDTDEALDTASTVLSGIGGFSISLMILLPHLVACVLLNQMRKSMNRLKNKEEDIVKADAFVVSPYFTIMSVVEIVQATFKPKVKVKTGATRVVPEETEVSAEGAEAHFNFVDECVISSEELGVENTLQATRAVR